MPGRRFSQSTDMAIHGVWALACLEEQRSLLLSEIARTQHVSESYLSKVFQKLAHAGLIQAVRGKNGGYSLARPPATITVGDVVRAIEADPPMYQCLAEERCCEAVENCVLLHIFSEAERQMYAVLDSLTLADLLAESMRGATRMSWLQPVYTLHTLTPLQTAPPTA
jgi:Rrf2 family protein